MPMPGATSTGRELKKCIDEIDNSKSKMLGTIMKGNKLYEGKNIETGK